MAPITDRCAYLHTRTRRTASIGGVVRRAAAWDIDRLVVASCFLTVHEYETDATGHAAIRWAAFGPTTYALRR